MRALVMVTYSAWHDKRVDFDVVFNNLAVLVLHLKSTGCKKLPHAQIVDIATTTVEKKPSRVDERDGEHNDAKYGTTSGEKVALLSLASASESTGRVSAGTRAREQIARVRSGRTRRGRRRGRGREQLTAAATTTRVAIRRSRVTSITATSTTTL